MKSFEEIVESVEKETPVVKYKLIESGLGYGGDEEKTRASSEDLTVCLAKFIGSFRSEIYSLVLTVKDYIEDYWGLDGWPGLDLETINNWDEFFAAIESHPDKTKLYECLNDQNFTIYKGGVLIMGSLDILKKVHELDPNILDKKVPFNQEPSKKPEPFFKKLSNDDLRKMGLDSLVSGQGGISFYKGS